MALQLESQGKVRVADIRMELEAVETAWQGTVFVEVVDQNGDPVEGVHVEAGWLGVVAGADSAGVTGEDGIAGPLIGRKNPVSKDISVCVVSVSHADYVYDKDANAMNCLFVEPDPLPTP